MVSFPALTDQLDALTAALDDPGTDLQAILDVLVDDLSAAVSSFLGLSDDAAVGVVARHPDRRRPGLALAAGASLALPLRLAGRRRTGRHDRVLRRGTPARSSISPRTSSGSTARRPVVLDGDLPGTVRPPSRTRHHRARRTERRSTGRSVC